MLRWFYDAWYLLAEAGTAGRDARIRFLKAQVEILRRKLDGNRVIPSPDDRARLLAIGQELDHDVADVIGIVTPQTYCRWVTELREGRKPKRVGWRSLFPIQPRRSVVSAVSDSSADCYAITIAKPPDATRAAAVRASN